jgi:hypothetical protein
MAVNPDPKPGRWILPLVILGMIAFTYFFVRELPEASTETTLVSGPETTTTAPPGDNGNGGDGSTTTTASTPLDPATQAYLDEVDGINEALQVQRTEIVTVNDGFNADPREVEYSDAESRFEAVETETQALAEQLRALTPPAGLEGNQQTMQAALDLAAVSAGEALAGLRSTDTGERRNEAVDAYVQAATDYDTELTNTHNAANANA